MKSGMGAFALACLLGVWPREASADGETVRVELPSCATLCFDALDFARLVTLELRADGWVVLDSSSSELADSQVTLAVELCATDECELALTIVPRGPAVRASNIGTRARIFGRWVRAAPAHDPRLVAATRRRVRAQRGARALGAPSSYGVSASLAVERTLLTRPRVTLGPTARLLTVLGQGRSNLGVPEQLGVGWAATLSGRVALEADIDESFTLVLAGELGGYVRELVFTGVGTPVASFAGFTGGITVGFTYDL